MFAAMADEPMLRIAAARTPLKIDFLILFSPHLSQRLLRLVEEKRGGLRSGFLSEVRQNRILKPDALRDQLPSRKRRHERDQIAAWAFEDDPPSCIGHIP